MDKGAILGIKYFIGEAVIFEPQEKKLSGNKKSVILSASATYSLTLLIEKKGELVKHDDFYEYVWRKYGMEPTAASLYQNISRLRGALKEVGVKEDVIRTMARRGFIIPGKLHIVMERKPSIEGKDPDVESDLNVPVQNLGKIIHTQQVDVHEKSTTQDTDENVEKKSEYLVKYKNRIIGSCLLLTLVVVTFFFLSSMPASPYKYRFSRDDCRFFLKTNSHDPRTIVAFSRNLSLNCTEKRYVYMTYYQASDRVSVFTCLKPLSFFRRSYCYSDYFIQDVSQ